MSAPRDDDDFDLDALKGALKAATPAPDPEVRRAHLRLAQENFYHLQGSRDAARLTSERPTRGVLQGVKDMLNALTTKGGLTATTALVAVGFLVLTPAGRDIWQRGPVGLQPPGEQVNAPEGVEELSGEVTLGEAVTDNGFADSAVEPPVVVLETAPQARAATPTPEAEQGALAPMGGLADGVSDMTLASPAPVVEERLQLQEPDTEAFSNEDSNPLQITAETPVSTFSIDVDTASYAVIRNSILSGALPPVDSVRVEEMINYFPYAYPAPDGDGAPFRPTVTVMETPWNPDTQLVRIGIQGEMPAIADRPPLNLVFLIDTSGSMDDPAKLPLLKQSFRLMVDQLRPEDEVAIVEYAGSAGLVLPATAATDRATILAAIDGLGAGGATNGQGGLEQAYATADAMAAEGEVSRVILATDGDFNVGVADPEGLIRFIEKKRESGTYLSVLGFGRGNLDDATMQALAQNGNGTAAYIDTLTEAQKVLVDQLTGALFPIAGDVKVQVEFNPAVVAEYRLIGYETRALRREDFNNDAVDAGELGAGHSVTALYEITPVGSPAQLSDPLRYGAATAASDSAEIGFLRLRWKDPGEDESQLLEQPIPAGISAPDAEANFAAAIAGFGQLLRGSVYLGDWGWDEAIALAAANRGADTFGYRNEAVQLMRLAQSLTR